MEYFLARRVTFVGLEDFARKTRHNKKINFFESFVFESIFMQDIKTNTLIVITIYNNDNLKGLLEPRPQDRVDPKSEAYFAKLMAGKSKVLFIAQKLPTMNFFFKGMMTYTICFQKKNKKLTRGRDYEVCYSTYKTH